MGTVVLLANENGESLRYPHGTIDAERDRNTRRVIRKRAEFLLDPNAERGKLFFQQRQVKGWYENRNLLRDYSLGTA